METHGHVDEMPDIAGVHEKSDIIRENGGVKNKDILISVIVVTYNQEATIARTLDSILMQECEAKYEIVIGDDCSTDGTDVICRRYAREYPDRIRYFRRAANLGLVKNYYHCIADSYGKYLADCAGDDFWVDSHKLQMQLEIMEADDEVALVHTDWKCCDIRGGNVHEAGIFKGIDRARQKEYAAGTMSPLIISHSPEGMIHLCTAMFRRDMLIREISKAPQLFMSPEYKCEDYQIEIALSEVGKIVYLPVSTLYYSVYEGSISHDRNFEKEYYRVKGNLLISERMRRFYNIAGKDIDDYYASQLDYLSAQAWHSHSRNIAKDYIKLRKEMFDGIKVNLKMRIKELFLRFMSY